MSPPDNASEFPADQDQLFQAALLYLMEDACATLDANGRILSVNAGMEELCDAHESVLLGKRLADAFPLAAAAIDEALGNGCAWEMHVDVKSAQAVLLKLYPAFHSNGDIGGWVTSARLDNKTHGDRNAEGENVDALTNLPGRSLVVRRLEAELRDIQGGDRQVTVLCIDLDGFDQINRDYGRAIGDQILIETAHRLGRSMRASNIIGRMQEDMFIVAIADIRSHEQINAVASRLLAAVAAPYTVKGVREPILLTACVGIAIAPENGHIADVLIGYAQTAVDLAKQTERGTYQFYSNSTGGEVRERRSMVNRLRRAIDEGEMSLFYQPKVSLVSGEIVAAEALVRWHEPNSGLIMPDAFIPLAEDAGLLDPLGHKLLLEACQTLRSWQDRGLPFLRVAVNVSAREIARASFFNDLNHILDETGVEPDSLELEITESSVMEGAEEIIRTLRDIRAIGVHLTADDFGTGYASLSYLRNFPLDGIKIDTTFVSDIERPDGGGGLASAVIAVGHCLGMNVIAEGVETKEQLKYLRWRDCDEVQGYLISEPLTADKFIDMVLEGPVL